MDCENIVITYREEAPSDLVQQNTSYDDGSMYQLNHKNFYHHLAHNLKMPPSSCHSYASTIIKCEEFALQHHLASWKLYATNKQTAENTIRELLNNQEFLDENKNKCNYFRKAIQKFLEFIDSDLTWFALVKHRTKPITQDLDRSHDSVLRQYFIKKVFHMNPSLETRIHYFLELCNVTCESVVITNNEASNSVSFDHNAMGVPTRNSFYDYLDKELQMAKATCHGYASAITKCEEFAKEHQLASWQLYDTDKQTAKKTCELLLDNEDFLVYNAQQYLYPRKAIKRFFAFLNSDLTGSASTKDNATPTINNIDRNQDRVLRQYLKKVFRMNPPLETRIRYLLELCNVNYKNMVITKTEISKPVQQEASTTHGATDTLNYHNFFCYLLEKAQLAKNTCYSYASSITKCEEFAKEHQLASWQIYNTDPQTVKKTFHLLLDNKDFLAYNAQQHYRFRNAIMKFLEFIDSDVSDPVSAKNKLQPPEKYQDESYVAVLQQYFKKGFRLDSTIEISKFKQYYTTLHTRVLTDSDDVISHKIKSLSIIYKGKAFLPEVMLSAEIKQQLLQYIAKSFADGKVAIYYQALFTEFNDTFLDYHIYDAKMLKEYLTFIKNDNFFIHKHFISQTSEVSLDPLSEIRSCLQDYGRPVTYDELFTALPHLPQSKIKFILARNVEFINNRHNEYFHESIVHLSPEDIQGISALIQQSIDEKDFISGNELYDAILTKYPYLIEENHAISNIGFRDVLKAKLGNKFAFNGNIISPAGQQFVMADVFKKYAQSHDAFTLSEIKSLAHNLDTVVYYEEIYAHSLRISQEQFVAKTNAKFPVDAMDEALDQICLGKYLPLATVTNFGAFPYVGFPWTIYLLEHYVASYSKKYMLIHSNFNGNQCVGAIVKRSANIHNLDELIIDLLISNPIELKQTSVLNFLQAHGYLARSRYANIEDLILKATAQRQRKEPD